MYGGIQIIPSNSLKLCKLRMSYCLNQYQRTVAWVNITLVKLDAFIVTYAKYLIEGFLIYLHIQSFEVSSYIPIIHMYYTHIGYNFTVNV